MKTQVPLDECVLLTTSIDLGQIALQHHLHLAPADGRAHQARLIQRVIQGADIAEDVLPLVAMVEDKPRVRHWMHSRHSHGAEPKNRLLRSDLEWQDCPVAIHLKSPATTVVAWTINILPGPGSTQEEAIHVLIVPIKDIEQVVRLLDLMDRPDRIPRMHVLYGDTQSITRCAWEDMTLEPQVTELLRDDVDFFLKGRKWFERTRLPYRRGYLMHGLPGNGKSSAIRCLMSEHGLSCFTLRLFDKDTDDSALSSVFANAIRKGPAIVLLEDIDRAFPRGSSPKCGISLPHLLNVLDGLASGEGIIVCGTANEPTNLDPAILHRPGRFDRVIHFAPPSALMRAAYFKQRVPEMPDITYERLATATDGASYAQLREAYIIAGQRAFAAHREIALGDLLKGIETLQVTKREGSRHSRTAGF